MNSERASSAEGGSASGGGLNGPRVRFAPSPTGHLHIGGARTALYNWLLARKMNGTFILRIEDTDTERSTQEYTASIIEGMKWLGLAFDEGPFFQMQRMDVYRAHVDDLLKRGLAYKCYCTQEELEEKRQLAMKEGRKPKYDGKCRSSKFEVRSSEEKPYSIRFKAPEAGATVVHDLVKGDVSFENKELDDLIILRSNGTPTYNFTVVVDDVEMKITHVIRGDDHLNNTPRQILMYQAFNYPVPKFAHLPMILGADKKRLSKRFAATSVLEYKAQGYLPEALLNYLARLGWAHGDQEIFTIDEMIKAFDLADVGKAAAVFDPEKLNWVNSQHLLKYTDEQIFEAALPFIEKRGIKVSDRRMGIKAVNSERERAKTFDELAEISAFYFRDEIAYDEKAKAKWLNDDGKKTLSMIAEKLSNLADFNDAAIADLFKKLIEETGKKMLDLAQPCRVALTGTTVSPGIYEVMAILGKETVLKRFKKAAG
ncbi:MAG: glutamate--tRNA ligase [Deltaproteobacteria bacterium]|nr:glutamate--tRNA ligase [Deltaproteobacteria bacterium]